MLGCYLLSVGGPCPATPEEGAGGLSGLAVITVGTSGVIVLVPDVGGSSRSSRDAISTLGELPGGCEIRPFVGASGGMMLVGASLNGGQMLHFTHTWYTSHITPLIRQYSCCCCRRPSRPHSNIHQSGLADDERRSLRGAGRGWRKPVGT